MHEVDDLFLNPRSDFWCFSSKATERRQIARHSGASSINVGVNRSVTVGTKFVPAPGAVSPTSQATVVVSPNSTFVPKTLLPPTQQPNSRSSLEEASNKRSFLWREAAPELDGSLESKKTLPGVQVTAAEFDPPQLMAAGVAFGDRNLLRISENTEDRNFMMSVKTKDFVHPMRLRSRY